MADSRRLKIAMGFDGGGSKTDCIVLDAEGKMIGRGAAGPANPLRVGFEATFKELAEAAARALAGAQLKPRQVDAVCAGLAGAGSRHVIRSVMVFLAREFPQALAQVTTDCDIALEAAVGQGIGVALLAGTGSAALGRNAAGLTVRTGGFGRAIGDEGSAYEMGRRAVACVARERDLAAPATILAETIPAALACSNWQELLERIAKNPDDVFPRLFPVVASAAESEDPAAGEILSAAAAALAGIALAATRRLGMAEIQFPLVKCGGVFGVSRILDGTLDLLLASAAPLARISRLEVPAALGAARWAARLANEPAPA